MAMRLGEVARLRTPNISLSTGIVIVTILGFGPLFGWAVAEATKLTLGLLVFVVLTPIFIRWPVESTFGVYVFLVAFDSVAVISDSGGSTVTRLVGIASVGVLLADGMIRGRLVWPPAGAIWWGLFMIWGILSAAWAREPELVFQRLPMALSTFILYLVAVCIRPSRTELLRV